MSFSNIPDEIVLHIFQNLQPLLNRRCNLGETPISAPRDISHLMLVCRRFQYIAEPILYSQFICVINDDGLFNFTRTIVTWPKLARHVRGVVLIPSTSQGDGEELELTFIHGRGVVCVPSTSQGDGKELEVPAFNDASKHAFNDAWETIKTTVDKYAWELRHDTFWRNVKNGRWESWLALLIQLLPRLKKLELCEASEDYDNYKHLLWLIAQIGQSQQNSNVTKHLCPSLEEITLVCLDTEYVLGLGYVLDMSRPRSVKKLNVGPVETEEWEPRETDTKLALKDITINNSTIGSEKIGAMLSYCPELERFSYQVGSAVVGFAQFEPSSIAPGLMTLKKTLQHLKIEDYNSEYSSDDDVNVFSAIGSLVSFTELKIIDVMSWMLILKDNYDNDSESEIGNPETRPRLVDVLPKSLESLRMDLCGPTIFEHVAELMEKRKERVPLLKNISLGVGNLGGGLPKGVDKEAGEVLVAGCKAHGVNLKIAYY